MFFSRRKKPEPVPVKPEASKEVQEACEGVKKRTAAVKRAREALSSVAQSYEDEEEVPRRLVASKA